MSAATGGLGRSVMQERKRMSLLFPGEGQGAFPERADGSVKFHTYEVQP